MKQTNRIRLRNDLLLIGALLVIAICGILYLFCFRKAGDMVTVSVDGKTTAVYPLSQNVEKEILSGVDGQNRNCLIIRDGKAYMESASCPDGICVDHAPIFRQGESIVCLPNRVVVTVSGEDGADIVV